MFENTLATISDTIGNVNQQFNAPAVQSETIELSEKDIRKRNIIRVVVITVILASITALIIYKKKQ